jgi:hypothetical protein
MSLVSQIIIGILILGVGVFFVLKTEVILDFFGSVDWAERHLGGTRLFYKLLGIVFILLGLIVATNMWNSLLNATIGSIFPAGKPN